MIGQRIGPYEIVEQLGKGGMATVYRAYHAQMERFVAIKVIHRDLAHDEAGAERFRREARLIARLEHPHLLPVHDFNPDHDPPYIVMRYLEGGTLKEVLESKRQLPLSEIAHLLRQIGGALDYAHQQGVIHRDIKPANIMIDRSGNAFVTDFGIARLMDVQGMTQTGFTVGTPGYMSPEQGLGDRALDQRSDVYSLGVMVFELATGRAPYTAETPMGLVLRHIQAPIPSVLDFDKTLPPELDAILQKALAKDPAERYASAGDFAKALADVVGQPINQTPNELKAAATMTIQKLELRRAAQAQEKPTAPKVGAASSTLPDVATLVTPTPQPQAIPTPAGHTPAAVTPPAVTTPHVPPSFGAPVPPPPPLPPLEYRGRVLPLVLILGVLFLAALTILPSLLNPPATPTRLAEDNTPLPPTLDPRDAALATRNSILTVTATYWTVTPTPNVDATINAELTRLAQEANITASPTGARATKTPILVVAGETELPNVASAITEPPVLTTLFLAPDPLTDTPTISPTDTPRPTNTASRTAPPPNTPRPTNTATPRPTNTASKTVPPPNTPPATATQNSSMLEAWRLAAERVGSAQYQDVWQTFEYLEDQQVAYEGREFIEIGGGAILMSIGTEKLRRGDIQFELARTRDFEQILQTLIPRYGFRVDATATVDLARVVAAVAISSNRNQQGFAYLIELGADEYTLLMSISDDQPQNIVRRDVTAERIITTLHYHPPEGWNTSPMFRSGEGEIRHDLGQFEPNRLTADVGLTNFLVETRFGVPYTDGKWDVGLYFRTTDKAEYLLSLYNDNTWKLRLTRYEDGRVTSADIDEGSLHGRGIIISDAELSANRWQLHVSGGVAVFYVNGTEIAHLDVSGEITAGSVALMSGSTSRYEQPNAILHYADFAVYPIDTPVALAATPEPIGQIEPVTRNADWQPLIQTLDGVEMVLVPPGCFMMGYARGFDTERPVHEQCFDQPFWIDRFEVTNEQVGSIGVHDGALRPRDSMQWAEARDYCLARGAHLPTEPEWEYAARGPDNWLYPWGNEFVADNVYYAGNSNGETVEVGSYPGGASWVGAQDLAGNVWEWVSSKYGDYPYQPSYEDDSDARAPRILRGGPDTVRVTLRIRYNPLGGGYGIGFRCARAITE